MTTILIDGEPVAVITLEPTDSMLCGEMSHRGDAYAVYRATIAAAPTAPGEAVAEVVRTLLRKIEFEWDGEPEDMIDARAALARVQIEETHPS